MRRAFRGVSELVEAIAAYVDQHNENPKPFIWTAQALDILEKVKRAREARDALHWVIMTSPTNVASAHEPGGA